MCLVQISPVWFVGLLARQNHTPYIDFSFEVLVHQLELLQKSVLYSEHKENVKSFIVILS